MTYVKLFFFGFGVSAFFGIFFYVVITAVRSISECVDISTS